MKRGTTFEEFEKDNQKWRQLMWALAILGAALFLASFLVTLKFLFISASAVVFGALLSFLDEPERLKRHYRISAAKECVKVDSFELQEFEKKGRIGKVFKNDFRNKVEFIYIDELGKINHKQFSSYSFDFKLLDCIDEEEIVITEERYVDDRFAKVLGKASFMPKYEIYVEIDNLKIIG